MKLAHVLPFPDTLEHPHLDRASASDRRTLRIAMIAGLLLLSGLLLVSVPVLP
jgi:hypothetical protein